MSAIHRMWGAAIVEYAESGSIGMSGGILTVWNPVKFKPRNVTIHRNFVMMSGVLLDFECVLVNVYAPNDASWSVVMVEVTLGKPCNCEKSFPILGWIQFRGRWMIFWIW